MKAAATEVTADNAPATPIDEFIPRVALLSEFLLYVFKKILLFA